MADGLVVTGATGVDIDNSVVGSSAYRQRVVVGADNSSGSLAAVSSGYPSTDAFGLNVRLIGSSGDVLGLVGLSSGVVLSSGTAYVGTVVSATSGVVNLSTTSIVGLTTTSLVGLSSGTAYLGVVVSATSGTVNLASGGVVTLSSGLAASTASIGTVALSSSTVIIGGLAASTAAIGSLTSGTAQIGTVVLTSGSAYLGVVVSATSGTVNLSTTSVVGLTTTALVGLSTTANVISGIVAVATNPTAIASGGVAPIMVDNLGRQIVVLEHTRQMTATAVTLTVANTSQQQFIAAGGAGIMNDILHLAISSTAGTTALAKTTLMFFTSSGQAEPGVYAIQIPVGPTVPPVFVDWDAAMPQLTVNNPWFVVSTSSAVNIRISALYVKNSS